jgi:hypothetical protein
MRIAVIIPDRGDRPEFMDQFCRMMERQTLMPEIILLIDFAPEDNECDITKRYKRGYELASGMDYDCILFMENDDYYAPNYIKTMIGAWINHDKPHIFGTNYTFYYHIGVLKYIRLEHFKRASMMNTLIVPDLKINWPPNNEPYTDAHLWKQLEGVTFCPKEVISIGIKHNVGMSGGHYHGTKMEKYKHEDRGMEFLKSVVDNESFPFYENMYKKLKQKF